MAEIKFDQIIQLIFEDPFSSAIVRQSDIFQSFKGFQKYTQNNKKMKDVRASTIKKN
jgi:hypothetical protein